jgi:DNA invertase Pin-like site-specific DNA recombinase
MSTDRQDNSPQRQRDQIEALARTHGYTIVAWYDDAAERGWDVTRPGFVRLIKDAQEKKFQFILADELSRLSRIENPGDYYVHFAIPLANAGVFVHCASGNLFLDWAEEDLGQAINHLIQRHKGSSEVISLAERSVKGLLSRARQGKLHAGPRMFGLDFALDENGNRTHHIPGPPDEVAAVKMMFRRYDEGASLADIVAELNGQGILTRRGKRWARGSVREVLMHPAFVGDYVFGRVARGRFFQISTDAPKGHMRRRRNTKGTKHDIERKPPSEWIARRDEHEAIISRDMFDRVQVSLKANRKHTSPRRAKGGGVLSGLLYCPACGTVMYGTTRQCRENIRVYVCGRYIRSGQCAGYWLPEDGALREITRVLIATLADPAEVERLRVSLQMQNGDNAADERAKNESLRQQVAGLTKQIEQAKARLTRIPDDMLDGYIADIRRMEAERTEKEARIVTVPPSPAQDIEQLVQAVKLLPDLIQHADGNRVHEFFTAAVERVDPDIRMVKINKYKRFLWEGGSIRLQSSLLSGSHRDRPRRNGRISESTSSR